MNSIRNKELIVEVDVNWTS